MVMDVIVQFTHPPTKDDLKLLGPYGQVKKNLTVINGVHISLSMSTILSVAKSSSVAYISPVRPLTGSLDVTTQSVNANLAWQFGWTGTGVGVAVIDSGIASRHDLTDSTGIMSRVVYRQSWVAGQAADDYGHGTHVAGIIGSSGADSTGLGFTKTFKGVAPNVNLIDLRVLDANGGGNDSGLSICLSGVLFSKATRSIHCARRLRLRGRRASW
jgi:serine protease AprX